MSGRIRTCSGCKNETSETTLTTQGRLCPGCNEMTPKRAHGDMISWAPAGGGLISESRYGSQISHPGQVMPIGGLGGLGGPLLPRMMPGMGLLGPRVGPPVIVITTGKSEKEYFVTTDDGDIPVDKADVKGCKARCVDDKCYISTKELAKHGLELEDE